MNGRWMAAIAALALAACTQDKTAVDETQTQTQVQQPSASIGSVVGRVTSSRDGAPLSGITVSTVQASGTVSTTTDATGAFALNGLSAGALYEVRFAKTGYVTRFGNALIPDQFGDGGTVYPRGNGVFELDMDMASADATVQGVVIQKEAAPAPGALLTVDLRSSGYDLVLQQTAGADGSFAFTGLPGTPGGFPLHIVSAPYSSTGSALPEYGAVTVDATTFPATTTRADVDLRTAAVGLALVYSDVDSGVHSLTPALTFTFNNGLNLVLTSATLADITTTAQTLATALSVDTTGAVLTVGTVGTPAPALVDQHTYQVTVKAVSNSGKTVTVTRTFFASGSAFTVPLPVTNLAITSPAVVDYGTTTLGLSWSASLGTASYSVYARDSGNNPGYVRVGTVNAPATSTVTTSVTLPAAFDTIAGAPQTPFGAGTVVTLVVVPIDANGASGAFTTQASISASDKLAPSVVGISTSVNPDNSAGATPRTVKLTVTFSEPMDKTINPTFTLSGFTPTFTPTFTNWTWANGTSVSADFDVPATTSAAGATVTVAGAKDASGNTLNSFTGPFAVTNPVLNPGFESGVLASWGPSGYVSLTSSSHSGTYAAFLGATGGASLTTSSVSQTFILPAGATSLSFYYRVACYDTITYDWATATLTDNTTAVTTTILPKECSNLGVWQQLSYNVSAIAGRSVTLTLTNRDDGVAGDYSYTLFDDVLVQ